MQIPKPENVPEINEGNGKISRFCRTYDPTQDFIRLWGTSYRDRVQSLWSNHIDQWKAGETSGANLEELLMVLVYDFTIAPYIPASDQRRKMFVGWLLDLIRVSASQRSV